MNTLLQYVSAVGLSSIILGAIHKYFYYKAFNIPIFHYISFSETLVLFEEFLLFVLLMFLLGGLFAIVVDNKADEITSLNGVRDENKVFQPYIIESGFILRFKQFVRNNKRYFWGLNFLLFLLVSLIIKLGPMPIILIAIYGVISIYFTLYLKDELVDRISRLRQRRFSMNSELMISMASFILPGFICYCFFSIAIVYNSSADSTMTIEMKDGIEVQTDSNLRYLGKTENYLFLYNIEDSISSILKMENVNEIRVKNIGDKIKFRN
jgi:hypothetical protein